MLPNGVVAFLGGWARPLNRQALSFGVRIFKGSGFCLGFFFFRARAQRVPWSGPFTPPIVTFPPIHLSALASDQYRFSPSPGFSLLASLIDSRLRIGAWPGEISENV